MNSRSGSTEDEHTTMSASSAGPLLVVASALLLAGCADDELPDPFSPPEGYPVLAWPLGGVGGADWVINNYVDLAPGAEILDYETGQKTYDGHRGVDIDVPNFRWMDEGFEVLAAAPGVVTALHDGEYDRNTACAGDWNYVEVTHENGSRAIYGHLRMGSISVALEEEVAEGQVLAEVGSSGCSTQPHLHFELRSPSDDVFDPFLYDLWADPPPYDPPLTFMDLSVTAAGITGVDDLKDPPPNVTDATIGSLLGFGLSMAGGTPGDEIRVTVAGGDGSLEYEMSVLFEQVYRHTYWYWNRPITANPGGWTMTVLINGVPVASHEFTVS